MRALQQDPDAQPVLGRQPEHPVWTPSRNLYTWYGFITPGQRFTQQQVQTLISRGADPVTIPAMTVKRQAKREEYWFSTASLPPIYVMECPIVGTAKDGRVRVVAPNGELKLVQADGWGHRPFRLPDMYRLAAA